MAIRSIVQALRTHNASEVISWGLPITIRPMYPLDYLLVSAAVVDNRFVEWFGLEETSRFPSWGRVQPPTQNSVNTEFRPDSTGMWFHRTVKKLAALTVNVRIITEKSSLVFILGWRDGACSFHISVCGFTVNTGTVLKQYSIFFNSFASQNLHMWKRTAEEEKITLESPEYIRP